MCDPVTENPNLNDSGINDEGSEPAKDEPCDIEPIYLNSSSRNLQESFALLSNTLINYFAELEREVMPQLDEIVTQITTRITNGVKAVF